MCGRGIHWRTWIRNRGGFGQKKSMLLDGMNPVLSIRKRGSQMPFILAYMGMITIGEGFFQDDGFSGRCFSRFFNDDFGKWFMKGL